VRQPPLLSAAPELALPLGPGNPAVSRNSWPPRSTRDDPIGRPPGTLAEQLVPGERLYRTLDDFDMRDAARREPGLLSTVKRAIDRNRRVPT
jgi:hypothetical protein